MRLADPIGRSGLALHSGNARGFIRFLPEAQPVRSAKRAHEARNACEPVFFAGCFASRRLSGRFRCLRSSEESARRGRRKGHIGVANLRNSLVTAAMFISRRRQLRIDAHMIQVEVPDAFGNSVCIVCIRCCGVLCANHDRPETDETRRDESIRDQSASWLDGYRMAGGAELGCKFAGIRFPHRGARSTLARCGQNGQAYEGVALVSRHARIRLSRRLASGVVEVRVGAGQR